MIYGIVICVFTLPFAGLTVYFDRKDNVALKTLFKSLASLCFVIAAVVGMAITSSDAYATSKASNSDVLILCGLSCGLVGDILLSLRSQKYQNLLDALGMLFFIAGHVTYIFAFALESNQMRYEFLALTIGLAVIMLVMFLIGVLKVPKKFMIVGIIVYALIIGCTLSAAAILRLSGNTTSANLIVSGTTLFALSDLLLAFTNYCPKANRKVLFPIVLVCYYVGQSLIALSTFV